MTALLFAACAGGVLLSHSVCACVLQRLRLVVEACGDRAAPSASQQEALLQCLRDVSSHMPKLADEKQDDARWRMLREVSEDEGGGQGLQVARCAVQRQSHGNPCNGAGRSWKWSTLLPRLIAHCLESTCR